MTKELLLDKEDEYFDGEVSIQNWARTRRQRILKNLSFESKEYNIYNPNFSSQNSQISRNLSSLERSIYEDFVPLIIEPLPDVMSSCSSTPSVAEERDTISLTPNAITPNLSRIMNICSISKIEQPSILISESGMTPLPYRAPKSQLSLNKSGKRIVYQLQKSEDLVTNQSKSKLIRDTIGRFKLKTSA